VFVCNQAENMAIKGLKKLKKFHADQALKIMEDACIAIKKGA
jgi:hypothetical protein